ncbi:hypothetical protein [Chelatococcus reniformis]|uniref:Uncharacterized protein n=1 Tax=Chelatococcus reniformis TaxID=1494448 RepID=A0A916UHG7_9HYPH|nr:hypothetical protein [Chelatococcus reniformis]GGC72078.1 hypothetical protein GCM10010994_33120 [Chelatococcus reniformis]
MNRTELMRLALKAEDEIIRTAQEILIDHRMPEGDHGRETIDRLWILLDGPEAHEARKLTRETLGVPGPKQREPGPDDEVEEDG